MEALGGGVHGRARVCGCVGEGGRVWEGIVGGGGCTRLVPRLSKADSK